MRAAACACSHLKMQMQDILLKHSQTEPLRGATRLDRWGLIHFAPAVCTECRILNFARTLEKIVQSQKKYWRRPNVDAMLRYELRNCPGLFPTKQGK